MMRFFRRYRQPLFLSILSFFFIGSCVGFGGYLFIRSDHTEAVAVVDGRKIPYLHYRVRVDQYLEALRQRKTEVTEAVEKDVKQGMLREMIVDELLAAQAERLGLRVSDLELRLSIQGSPAFQREGRFDQNLYFQAVRYTFRTSPEQYEKDYRRQLLSAKLKALVLHGAKLAPEELRSEYARRNKGSLKGFEKEAERFTAALRQERALDALNFYLRQLSTQVDIRSYLDRREQGA